LNATASERRQYLETIAAVDQYGTMMESR
jgi:hypothetical protein